MAQRSTNGSTANGGSMAATFCLGAMTGAALALLWAPANGRDTRAYLRTKARAGADGASRAMQSGRRMIGRQKERIDEAVGEGRQHLNQAAGHAAHAAATGRQATAEIAEDGRKALGEVGQAVREGRDAAADVARDLKGSAPTGRGR